MIGLITELFGIGFASIFLVLAVDILIRKHGQSNRRYVSGGIAILVYSSFLYLTWILRTQLDMAGTNVSTTSFVTGPLSTTLQVSTTGLVIFTIAGIIGLMVALYSIGYMSNFRNIALFNALLILLGVNLFGITIAGDLLTLFIFWEGMSICAYGLVIFKKRDMEAVEAAMKYLLMAGVGSIIALFGIALIYFSTGTLSLESLADFIGPIVPGTMLLGILLLVFGFGVEAAIVPLHTWLPDAYYASTTPVSTMLSGIVTATGAYTILRLLIGPFTGQSITNSLQPLLLGIAVLTMFVGNLSALGQDDLRRLLAFSSIGQVGYIFLGISTFTMQGASASIFQIWNHAFLKAPFFMLSGIIGYSIGSQKLSEMAGIGRRNHIIGLLVTIDALALTGLPPFGMFWSELFLVLSALQLGTGMFFTAAFLMLVSIVISIIFYFKILRKIAFDSESNYLQNHKSKHIPLSMLIPSILLISISLLSGFFPFYLYGPILNGVKALGIAG